VRIIAICAGDETPDGALSAAATLAALHNTAFEIIRIAPDNGAAPEQCARACADWLQQNKSVSPYVVLTPPGAFGQAFGAYLAAFTGARALGRCETIEIDGANLRVTRSAFGGRASLTIEVTAENCIAQMRPVDGAPLAPQSASTEIVASDTAPLPIERIPLGEQKVNLEGAQIIVSGGRGLDPEGFALLEEVAASLGGAVGASLPAIDAGLAPVSRQIGQSGKFVTPRIYVAVALSGTPQHLAGIGEAVRIFAINKDADAPIFGFAEIGLLADWRHALPLLRDYLNNAR
jgi:electron transfer flavoprotein alpha subunit